MTFENGHILIKTGILEQKIALTTNSILARSWTVAGRNILASSRYPQTRNFSLEFSRANPDRRPKGLQPGDAPSRPTGSHEIDRLIYGSAMEDDAASGVRWDDPVYVTGPLLRDHASGITHRISRPNQEMVVLTLSIPLVKPNVLKNVEIVLYYEVFEKYPVIRKRLEVHNRSGHWLRLRNLLIEDFELTAAVGSPVLLTPWVREIDPSLAGFTSYDQRYGFIAGSEIPSGLRRVTNGATMGYTRDLFEWVLGPAEAFVSEPVFYFAFSGEVQRTASAVSTPMDRVVEGPLQRFLDRQVIQPAKSLPLVAPQWVTWAGFGAKIDDALIRQQANLAARAGFKQLLIDDGWQGDRVGTDVDAKKFPDFSATAKYVRSLGLSLGLWVADFRGGDSRDLRRRPDARIEPPRVMHRKPEQPLYAMSFSSPWRDEYARDLVRLHESFGVDYFKQDLTAFLYGNIAGEHGGRTKKDSLLRSLRGLLASQDEIRRLAPNIVTELTHEIYWGTPGASCDIAALKHATQFHTPLNDCLGELPPWGKAPPAMTTGAHRQLLLDGCAQSRERFFAHRGLPLHRIEFYALATQNYQGSLTPEIQDRQVASMLVGAPLTFSGDLRWLTDENIAHYRRRFDLLERLQRTYDIYRHYQFSGVPAPTDQDWHWWGKLNESGVGAVVVLRGSGGADSRAVNLPWVDRERRYRVTACFAGKNLGEYSGAELQERGLAISLAAYGQEILELADAGNRP